MDIFVTLQFLVKYFRIKEEQEIKISLIMNYIKNIH